MVRKGWLVSVTLDVHKGIASVTGENDSWPDKAADQAAFFYVFLGNPSPNS